MLEIDFYEEFASRFSNHLKYSLGDDCQIEFSCNKRLDQMLNELSEKFGLAGIFGGEYIPKLKLDIVLGVKYGPEVHLILVEGKYLKNLSLKDYSQLTGYLQVAKRIKTGILLLIPKRSANNRLSNDFRDIVSLQQLPLQWSLLLNGVEFPFNVGIVVYTPGNGINWIETRNNSGISSFDELAARISSDRKTSY